MKTEAGAEGTMMRRNRAKNLTYVAAAVALLAVCSWISIPTAVPFTMQTFGVFMVVGLLGGRLGTAAIAIYILTGAVGLPVFAGFSGGPGVIMGLTGGYIAGFSGSALFMWATEKIWKERISLFFSSSCVGLLICYLFGTLWFMKVYTDDAGTAGIMTALSMCVFPYIAPDLVKIGLAVYLVKRLRPLIKR